MHAVLSPSSNSEKKVALCGIHLLAILEQFSIEMEERRVPLGQFPTMNRYLTTQISA
jgi:hypothetical protein